MSELKKHSSKDTLSVLLILFSCLYVGIGITIFQVFSSDFKEFPPPFLNPLVNSLTLPTLILIIPTILLTLLFTILSFINKRVSMIYLCIIIAVSITLYSLRANYLLNSVYTPSSLIIGCFFIILFLAAYRFNRFIFTFFQILTLVSAPLTLYFSYQYYNFLKENKSTIINKNEVDYFSKIGNKNTPVFFIIFDELSSYILMDENKQINKALFPELNEFAKISTWYPNAVTQVSETLTTTSSMFSGHDELKNCSGSEELCGHTVIWNLVKGKIPTKDIRNLNGIKQKTNKIDLWTSIDKYKVQKDTLRILIEPGLNNSLKNFLKQIIDLYLLSIQNSSWSVKIFGADTYLDLTSSNHAKGAIVDGIPKSYGFLACATKANRAIIRFNLFTDRIDPQRYFINSILTSLTHTPLCFDSDGIIEVVYPIRPLLDDNEKVNYLPDAVAMSEYAQTSCTSDEISINIRRARINQSMLAMKMFNKTITRIKELGLFDKSLIIAVSDHGVGFLGPSFGRANHKLRNSEDILDNRMMNASTLLMIKYPHQKQPQTDYRMVRPIDIGATLMDIIEFDPPWDIDGQSLLSDNWKNLSPPLDFFQIMYEDNQWKNKTDSGTFLKGKISEPLKYFDTIKHKFNKLTVYKSKWIDKNAEQLPLMRQKSGKLEYLKIEKTLPTENSQDYILTLGGYSVDPKLNPASLTYISVNGKIIKAIKPCLSFNKSYHYIGSILAGWVVIIPSEFIKSKNIKIRAFSKVENSNEEFFYELENPINIELTDEQFNKVGYYDN